MATSLHRVFANFVLRIEDITPTNVRVGGGKPFRQFDPLGETPDNSSGWIRRFFVERLGADADDGGTDNAHREADHRYQLVVLYPDATGRHQDREEIMAQDRHDILKQMRDTSLWDGFASTSDTTDIGIWRRYAGGDEVVDFDDNIKALAIEFDVRVNEDEDE